VGLGILTLLLCWVVTTVSASRDEGRCVPVGTVTKVNGQTGWLELDMGGPVILHFQPSALEALKPGDRVAVDLLFVRTPATAVPGEIRLVGDSGWQGHHTVQGDITSIDAGTALIHINTSEGAMAMHLLPGDARNLQVNDRLTIAYSFKLCPGGSRCLGGRRR